MDNSSRKLTTSKIIKAKVIFSELQPDKVIKWDQHIAKTLGSYDMIIGQDILQFLGIDIKFSTMTVEWNNQSIPFRDVTSTSQQSFYIKESKSIQDATKRIKQILEAKYKPADLNQICQNQEHLSSTEKEKLLKLLCKYNNLFDGTLGKWKGSKVNLDLKSKAELYHTKAFPIPRIHSKTLKMEVD